MLIYGSSPHARGTLHREYFLEWELRFIPARTGNTIFAGEKVIHVPVHPRTHGEHSLIRDAIRTPHGSSPHARGTQRRRDLPRPFPRFIPARTGNTESVFRCSPFWTVHPRTHGEHGRSEAGQSPGNGSSPHARGTLVAHRISTASIRFIPARTGNTVPQVVDT